MKVTANAYIQSQEDSSITNGHLNVAHANNAANGSCHAEVAASV